MGKKTADISLNDYKPLRDVIFDYLREAIINGNIKPGERLMEIKFAEKMGVSRTPVREAIRKLELEGLVVMLPRKGAHAAELSVKDIMNVLEVRSSLDALATSLASQRIRKDELKELKATLSQFEQHMRTNNVQGLIKKDVEFHAIIYKASRNEKLSQISENLKNQIHRYRTVYLKDYSSPKELVKEHTDIYNAIESRNSELASELAFIHIKHQEKAMISSLKKGETIE
jgi:DNA-binding GntR family transcriptional regulator